MNRKLIKRLGLIAVAIGLILPAMTGCGPERPPQYDPPSDSADDTDGSGGGYTGTKY